MLLVALRYLLENCPKSWLFANYSRGVVSSQKLQTLSWNDVRRKPTQGIKPTLLDMHAVWKGCGPRILQITLTFIPTAGGEAVGPFWGWIQPKKWPCFSSPTTWFSNTSGLCGPKTGWKNWAPVTQELGPEFLPLQPHQQYALPGLREQRRGAGNRTLALGHIMPSPNHFRQARIWNETLKHIWIIGSSAEFMRVSWNHLSTSKSPRYNDFPCTGSYFYSHTPRPLVPPFRPFSPLPFLQGLFSVETMESTPSCLPTRVVRTQLDSGVE